MRRVPKILIYTVASFVLAANSWAIVPDSSLSHYGAIPERNVFGLRPPSALPLLTNSSAPLPKIILTGITTILGDKRVLMKVLPAAMKPSDAAKELSLILAEGQREGEIEVLQIDERVGSVRVNNSGTVVTLTFEKDGAKLPASAPAPGELGVPRALPVAGVPTTNPYGLPAARRRLLTRTPHVPAVPVPTASGLTSSPVGGVPTPTGAVPSPDQTVGNPGQELTAEEQAIALEIQRQARANDPSISLVAPTPLPLNASQPTEGGTTGNDANLPVQAAPPRLVPQ
jgi:hypothetical protein